jgi:hypothetical protein
MLGSYIIYLSIYALGAAITRISFSCWNDSPISSHFIELINNLQNECVSMKQFTATSQQFSIFL